MANKSALIIGNSDYRDSALAHLAMPVADVNALADVLRDPQIGNFDEVKPFVNCSFADVRLEIESFFDDKKPDDLLLLYYTGHGVRDDQGQLYLAVNDTRHNRLRATAIDAAYITSLMDRSRSRRQVLILDCCHSGSFAQGSKAMTGESVGTKSAFEGTGYGRVVLTATDATQYAWEGDQIIGEALNSVFTLYLLQGLRTGEADTDGDGEITLDELYDYVYEKVVSVTPKQTPGKWSYKQQGEIVIASNPHVSFQPAALPPELEQAIESPFAAVREGAVRELEKLLTGKRGGLALAAQATLQQMLNDDSLRVARAARAALATAKSVGPGPAGERRLQPSAPLQLTQRPSTAQSTQTEEMLPGSDQGLDIQRAAPIIPVKRLSPWTYGRIAVLVLLLLGFLGPWVQVAGCASQANPSPPPTVVSGGEVYALLLLLWPPSLLIGIPVSMALLFLLTLVRVVYRIKAENVWVRRGERFAVGSTLIGLGTVPLFGLTLLWGFWSTLAAVLLAPINLVAEWRSSRESTERAAWWVWLLAGLVVFAVLMVALGALRAFLGLPPVFNALR